MTTITTHSDAKARKTPRFLLTLLLVLLATAASAPQAFAQKKNEGRKSRAEMMQEVREFKIKYLIQECEIPKDKQDDFIRIYYDLEDERIALAKETIDARKAIKKKQNPTDEDYLHVADLITDFHSKEGAVEKSYYNQLKKILTPKQLYQLKISEHRFNDKLMKMRKGKK